jgi:hypothetical protein
MIQISEKEIKRKEELPKVLDELSHQFSHLVLVKKLPDDLDQRQFVVNRALDARSAAMVYLAIEIRHISTRFGTAGKEVRLTF